MHYDFAQAHSKHGANTLFPLGRARALALIAIISFILLIVWTNAIFGEFLALCGKRGTHLFHTKTCTFRYSAISDLAYGGLGGHF